MSFGTERRPFIVVHVPHASTVVPEHVRSIFCLSDAELQHELLVMTDWYTDDIVSLPTDIASTVVFPVSRLVVDPERFTDDQCEPMASKGMGVTYTTTSDGKALRNVLSAEERQSLLDAYYFPHHKEIVTAVRDAVATHGSCLLIDAHSFSSKPLPHEPDQASGRCGICLGTDEFHTPSWLVDWLTEAFQQRGFAVDVNRPFSGTLVPPVFYRKDRHVLSIMIEINRSLYMDEATGSRLPSYRHFQTNFRQVLLDLAATLQARLAG